MTSKHQNEISRRKGGVAVDKTCEMIQEQLLSYIDGELRDEDAAVIDKHLTGCDVCRKEYEFLCGILKTANELPVLKVDASLHARILQGAEQAAKTQKPLGRTLWRTVSGFAAAAAVIALSVVTLNSLPGHPELLQEELTDHQTEINQTIDSAVTSDEEQTPSVALTAEETREKQPAASKSVQNEKTFAPVENSAVAKAEQEVPEAHVPATVSVMPESDTTQGQPTADAIISNDPAITGETMVDDKNPMPEVASESRRISGDAVTAVHEPALHYYMTAEGYEEAVNLLAIFSQEDGTYLIPVEEKDNICNSLQALSGYLRHIEDVLENEEQIRIALYME